MNKKEQIEKLKQHYHKKFKDRFRIIGKRVTEEELEKVLKGVN